MGPSRGPKGLIKAKNNQILTFFHYFSLIHCWTAPIYCLLDGWLIDLLNDWLLDWFICLWGPPGLLKGPPNNLNSWKTGVLELFLLKRCWGGKFHVKILSSGVEHQKKRSGAPQGPIQGAPRCSKRLKMGKNGQNLSSFDNEGPSYLFSFPHQCSRTR